MCIVNTIKTKKRERERKNLSLSLSLSSSGSSLKQARLGRLVSNGP